MILCSGASKVSDSAALFLVVVNSAVFNLKMIQDDISSFSEDKNTESQKKIIASYID